MVRATNDGLPLKQTLSPSCAVRQRRRWKHAVRKPRTQTESRWPGWRRRSHCSSPLAYTEAPCISLPHDCLNFKAQKQLKRDFRPSAPLKLWLALGRKLRRKYKPRCLLNLRTTGAAGRGVIPADRNLRGQCPMLILMSRRIPIPTAQITVPGLLTQQLPCLCE